MECLFFINPTSGAGRGQKLAEEIESFQLPLAVSKQIVFTDPPRLHSQVHSCACRKDLVVICGGDGTINGVISHLIHLELLPAVAFIPLGTGNDIARATYWHDSWENLGLTGLYHAIKRAQTTWIDVWELSFPGREGGKGHIFVAYAGFGCDGLITRQFAHLSDIMGTFPLPPQTKRLLYILPGMKASFRDLLGKTRFDFTVSSLEAKTKKGKIQSASQLLFLNVPSYAGGNLVMRDNDFSDGRLDCLMFKSCMDYFLRLFIYRFSPGRARGPSSRAKGFNVKLYHDVHFQKDGEPCGTVKSGTRVLIRLRRAIPLLKPLKDDLCRNRISPSDEEEAIKKAPVSEAKPVIT